MKNTYLNIEQNICHDNKAFWKYVKDRRSDRWQCSQYQYKDKLVSGSEAADAFADYFSSVFHTDIPCLDVDVAERHTNNTCFGPLNVTIERVAVNELKNAVRHLKPFSSTGPDAVPPYLAKDCISALETPLLYIYNLCLKNCVYPTKWKLSKVTPVPKKKCQLMCQRTGQLLFYLCLAKFLKPSLVVLL